MDWSESSVKSGPLSRENGSPNGTSMIVSISKKNAPVFMQPYKLVIKHSSPSQVFVLTGRFARLQVFFKPRWESGALVVKRVTRFVEHRMPNVLSWRNQNKHQRASATNRFGFLLGLAALGVCRS